MFSIRSRDVHFAPFTKSQILICLIMVIVIVSAGPVVKPSEAQAADSAQFDAGNIISDSIFFDGLGYSSSQVQSFLNSKVTACRDGYTCLRDYSQATPNMPNSPNRCAPYSGSPAESAAQIISKVGVACGINPKVLLVLLQKEQSLVTDTWPLDSQYRNATGFACPDTAPCDPSFSGFFYQVYYAARQFKTYALYPDDYNYRPGRVNNVLYNPNRDCGSSGIYIQNQATANLYIYTPYQPNQAALSNLYGTGDGCSAYGNRNFWRIFTDWFGTTQSGVLFRSPNNPAVYVISQNVKHLVPDMETFGAYSPTGGLTFVSDNYLNSVPTGSRAGRIIRNDGGGIFFIDAGIRLHFTTCEQVVEYGGSCEPTGYVQLSNREVNRYVSGPAVQPVLGTREGPSYWIKGGLKREILDTGSLAAANLPTTISVILTQNAVSNLSWGPPVVRDEVLVQSRESGGAYYFVAGGKKILLTAKEALGLGPSTGKLSGPSLNQIPSGQAFDGSVAAPDGRVGLLSPQGISVLSDPNVIAKFEPIPIPQGLFDSKVKSGDADSKIFLKGNDNPTIFLVDGGTIRPLDSWKSFTVLAGSPAPLFFNVAPSAISQFLRGPKTLTPGELYRSPENPSVYLVDGMNAKVPVGTFDTTQSFGITGLKFVPGLDLAAFNTAPGALGYGVQCGNEKFVGAGGGRHVVSPSDESLYPFSWTQLDPVTCAQITLGKPAGAFIRAPGGGIYLLENGTKRLIPTMARLFAIGGSAGWLEVSSGFASSIPNGPPA